jgi:hypothetical protein
VEVALDRKSEFAAYGVKLDEAHVPEFRLPMPRSQSPNRSPSLSSSVRSQVHWAPGATAALGRRDRCNFKTRKK